MNQAFICDGVRTPFGRFGGTLSSVRSDDLAALPLKALIARHPNLDWSAVDDVIYGCANQAGKITATWRVWLCCWRGYQSRYRGVPSTVYVDQVLMRWVLLQGLSKAVKRS